MTLDRVSDIFKMLKEQLKDAGIDLSDNIAANNRILTTLSLAISEGIEIGEKSGKIKTLDLLEENLNKMKEDMK